MPQISDLKLKQFNGLMLMSNNKQLMLSAFIYQLISMLSSLDPCIMFLEFVLQDNCCLCYVFI